VFEDTRFDIVLTVCDAAAAEPCPVSLGDHDKLHWSIADPAQAAGDDAAIDAAFDQAFDLIRQRIVTDLLPSTDTAPG
jgi:arsenate reductase